MRTPNIYTSIDTMHEHLAAAYDFVGWLATQPDTRPEQVDWTQTLIDTLSGKIADWYTPLPRLTGPELAAIRRRLGTNAA